MIASLPFSGVRPSGWAATLERAARPRISDGQKWAFTWDYRNRPLTLPSPPRGRGVGVRGKIKNSGGTVLLEDRFTYDVWDHRIGKWVDSDGAGPGAGVRKGDMVHYCSLRASAKRVGCSAGVFRGLPSGRRLASRPNVSSGWGRDSKSHAGKRVQSKG